MDFPQEKIWQQMKPNNETRASTETLRLEARVKPAPSTLRRWNIPTTAYWNENPLCSGFTHNSAGVWDETAVHSETRSFIWSFKREIRCGRGRTHGGALAYFCQFGCKIRGFAAEEVDADSSAESWSSAGIWNETRASTQRQNQFAISDCHTRPPPPSAFMIVQLRQVFGSSEGNDFFISCFFREQMAPKPSEIRAGWRRPSSSSGDVRSVASSLSEEEETPPDPPRLLLWLRGALSVSDRVLIISGLMCSRTALVPDSQTDVSPHTAPPTWTQMAGECHQRTVETWAGKEQLHLQHWGFFIIYLLIYWFSSAAPIWTWHHHHHLHVLWSIGLF